MAQIKVRLWSDRARPFAGKMTIFAETDEERAMLQMLKGHAGITQTGARLDVVYRWKPEKEQISGE